MKNKGQALIEFVMILPILLFLIFALFDISKIVICKSHLENVMDEVLKLSSVPNELMINNYLENETEYKINSSIVFDEHYLVTLETSVELITPGLKNILKSPYNIKAERRVISCE